MFKTEYDQAVRYFGLFQEVLKRKHCDLAFNLTTGKCTVIGGTHRGEFKFDFDKVALKNHYCTFRIGNDEVDVYLAKARSQSGVPNWFQQGLKTPPNFGD